MNDVEKINLNKLEVKFKEFEGSEKLPENNFFIKETILKEFEGNENLNIYRSNNLSFPKLLIN